MVPVDLDSFGEDLVGLDIVRFFGFWLVWIGLVMLGELGSSSFQWDMFG